MLLSYRSLIWFWGGVAWVLVVGGSTLQLFGPPSHAPQEAPTPVSATLPPAPPALTPPTPAPPSVANVDQVASAIPVLPTILAPAAIEETATISTVPILSQPALSQPSRERPRSLVRRNPALVKAPKVHGDGEDAAFGERSPLAPAAESAVPARHEQVTVSDHPTGYIGVFATGTDGTRTFKAMP